MTKTHNHTAITDILGVLSRDHLQGKEEVLRLSLIALLTGGHILIEDLPGLGKTTIALALAAATGLSFGRVQCTSDLLPSDITGLSVFNREEGRFIFVPGPVFSNIVLLDEINRAMPRTQSAMLEAMEERRVTVEGGDTPSARSVYSLCHPESFRPERNLSAARVAAGSVSDLHRHRLSA